MDTFQNRELSRRCLNLDVYPCRETELIQSLNGLGGCLLDIDQTLVSSDLELLTSLFIDIRAGKNGITLNPGGQRNRTVHFRVRSLCGVYDLQSTLIQYRMVVSLHSDSNNFMRSGHSTHRFQKNTENAGFEHEPAAQFPHVARGRQKDREGWNSRQSQNSFFR